MELEFEMDLKGKLIKTGWGDFENTPRGICEMGLAQLLDFKKNGIYQDINELNDDIAAYNWIIDNELCDRYLITKNHRPVREVALNLGWRSQYL